MVGWFGDGFGWERLLCLMFEVSACCRTMIYAYTYIHCPGASKTHTRKGEKQARPRRRSFKIKHKKKLRRCITFYESTTKVVCILYNCVEHKMPNTNIGHTICFLCTDGPPVDAKYPVVNTLCAGHHFRLGPKWCAFWQISTSKKTFFSSRVSKQITQKNPRRARRASQSVYKSS